MISKNLSMLRKIHKMTLENVAESIGVSRQAVAKWERGISTPDIKHCNALAQLFNVSLDDLVNHQDDYSGALIAPRGKHLFGTVTVDENGVISIPQKALKIFKIRWGDQYILLGDEDQGLALIRKEKFINNINNLLEGALDGKE